MNWYLETELHHGTVNLEDFVEGFILTFNFEYDFPCIYLALQTIRENIFGNATSLTWKQLDWTAQLEQALECYNINAKEDEDPHNMDITKLEGNREVIGIELEIPDIVKLVKR